MDEIRKPEPGRPVHPEFYRHVLDRWDALVQEGAKDPAAQLALEMEAHHSTVRGWVSRGRKYLGRESKPIHHAPHCRTCSCFLNHGTGSDG